jgi:uncharacterized protein (DUF779 family)
MGAGQPLGVVATAAAIAVIERLKAEHGPLELFLSGGCCDGSSPMCFPQGELLLGPNDLRLGSVAGCPFYVDADQYARWGRPGLVLDVGAGAGSGMSLEEAEGVHFRLAAPSAVSCRRAGMTGATSEPTSIAGHTTMLT